MILMIRKRLNHQFQKQARYPRITTQTLNMNDFNWNSVSMYLTQNSMDSLSRRTHVSVVYTDPSYSDTHTDKIKFHPPPMSRSSNMKILHVPSTGESFGFTCSLQHYKMNIDFAISFMHNPFRNISRSLTYRSKRHRHVQYICTSSQTYTLNLRFTLTSLE